MRVFYIIYFLFINISCQKDENCPKANHSIIYVKNLSQTKIYCNNITAYNNSASNFSDPTGITSLMIIPNEKNKFYSWRIRNDGSCWESKINIVKTIKITFYDAAILEKVPWKDVQEKGTGVLERREIDLDYLIKNNWEVVYK